MRRLVAEDGAIDAGLPAVVDKIAPHEAGIAALGSQDDFLAGTNEQFSLTPIGIAVRGVVALIEF